MTQAQTTAPSKADPHPPKPADTAPPQSAGPSSTDKPDAALVPLDLEAEPDLSKLLPHEIYWRDNYDFLFEKGYQLRSRFKPDWVPSWTKNGRHPLACEDGHEAFGNINHGFRIKDHKQVVFKRVSDESQEQDILQYLSLEGLETLKNNIGIPVFDILKPPKGPWTIAVMPLARKYDDPEFDTIGEAVGFIQQIFQGVEFLHDQAIAHRDLDISNIMMDPSALFPAGFHPYARNRSINLDRPAVQKGTRTDKPTRYWLIDFGYSKQYPKSDMPSPKEVPFKALKSTIPEFNDPDLEFYDPFPTDVYCLGEIMMQEFLEGDPRHPEDRGRVGFEWMRPLLVEMMNKDPSKRPDMKTVVAKFNELVGKLDTKFLRSRCISKTSQDGVNEEDYVIVKAMKVVPFWARRVKHLIQRHQPIPETPPRKPAQDL